MKELIATLIISLFVSPALAEPFGDFQCPGGWSTDSVITKVEDDGAGGYKCLAEDYENWFQCSNISPFVDGSVLPGLKVMIHVQVVDACHVPGACGSRACMEWATAELNSMCSE